MPLDEDVRRAMARWPSVPAMHGWLRLTRRGRWMLIDRGRPGFDEALHGQGSEITSPPIVDFIGRNYLCDEAGHWYWQNGPQRVFVDLDLAPLYFRVMTGATDAVATGLITHTGYPVSRIDRVALDAQGNLWLDTDLGPGCIDDRDLAQLEISLDPDSAAPRASAMDRDADAVDLEAQAVDFDAQMSQLRLLGDHPVERLDQSPAVCFRFVSRPRPD